MRHNSTLKRSRRLRRKTSKSGGAKGKLSAASKAFVPTAKPNAVNDLSALMSAVAVSNTREANYMPPLGHKGKLSAAAKEWVPAAKTNTVNDLSASMAAVTVNNMREANYMSLLAAQMATLKGRIENAVAIDCEMVGMKPYDSSALAHVAIVNFNGERIYDKYVIPKGGIEQIYNYRTEYSGIEPSTLAHLDSATHSFDVVKREVHRILEGKTVVGHGLVNDFKVLEFEPAPGMTWDSIVIDTYLQTNPYTGARQARKLKVIAKEFANNNIQMPGRTGHSPLEDARASMNLYRVAFGYPKIRYANMSK